MTTIKEVADLARVSVATVSRVINKTGYVSIDLQERVTEAMQSLHYQPSALARGLRRQTSQTVGVLVPILNHPFYSTLAYAIEKTLFADEYRVFICSAEESAAKEDAYVDMLLRQRVDGVIMVPTGQSAANVSRLIEHRVPVVLVDRDLPPTVHVSRVLVDNRSGAGEMVRYLASLGHYRIGAVGGPSYSTSILERFAGAHRAAADLGLEPLAEVLLDDRTPMTMGQDGMQQLLARTPRPTAIFALNDLIAVGALHAAGEAGLRVPQDLSLASFDDVIAAYVPPGLTTMAQPILTMGETAARLLLRQIADPDTPGETFMLETRLVVRKSTAPLIAVL